MKRRYDSELSELASTYRTCVRTPIDELDAALGWRGPAVFAGSGGALAAARLAADLHTSESGAAAVATTPLSAATTAYAPDVGLVMFTARGRHPDAAMTVRAGRLRGASHLAVVSARRRDELPPELSGPDVFVATVPSPPDGFLATNSVLAMATAICRAHCFDLPGDLPAFHEDVPRPTRRSALVLTGPGLNAVGCDLEARLGETGLADAQVTDFRNLAHGRHVGLLRKHEHVTVVAISDQTSKALADRTLALLPPEIDVIRLESPLPGPASVLDLLVRSMQLTSAIGRDQGVDPGRPGVAEFGRRLYHLPTTKLVTSSVPSPGERKCREAVGLDRSTAEAAALRWVSELADVEFGGIVLDYDGTCCSTWDRFRPPPADVQEQLFRLLDGGVMVGFASGRGRSLHVDTRSWLPPPLWDRVQVGLYNGTYLTRLSDDLDDFTDCDGDLAAAADRLTSDALSDTWIVERRRTQVSVSAATGRATGAQLLPMVKAVLARPPALPCKALASGHSVDIILTGTGKAAVVDAVGELAGRGVLTIGDQGQADGNDFELLATVTSSLSVDRCSPDLTRCWNLDVRGERGPSLLVRYLRALDVKEAVARFRWHDR